MATSVQAERPITVSTPLPASALLLVGFSGSEAISHLFSFQLDLLAENKTDIPFDKVLGGKVTISLALGKGKKRYWNGICSRVSQGERDETFTSYRMEVVPKLWLLTRRVQSRIFQHVNIKDILKKVLDGVDISDETQGTFYPRDYCVQYQETDFNFASRLMEEEGIFYFFKHTADGHKMVLANDPSKHADMPEQSKVIYEKVHGGERDEFRVWEWQKVQELRSGKYTLRDHCFELPDKPGTFKDLQADKATQESVPVGKVAHKLKVADNDKLEIYNYPGGYAQRFDGVDKGGGPKPDDLQKIFEDAKRVAQIRMQEEAAQAVLIQGTGNCRQFVSGYKFTLEKHFNADGPYMLTGVHHTARWSGNYRSGQDTTFDYSNTFTCLPLALPYRPARTAGRPRVHGTQTAVVVGPPGEEIFTDKYSRIKVQFHWDRDGKHNADSSCWIRVATNWAGKGWGFLQIPRIGQEVIVDFLEGDPDNPIVIGSVYNAEQMPAGKLPDERSSSGLKSNSTPGGGGYNGLIVNDTKKKEMITLHGQKDMTTTIEHDDTVHIKNDETITVDGKHTETIDKDTSITVKTGNFTHEVKTGTAYYYVKGSVEEKFDATLKATVKGAVSEEYKDSLDTVVTNGIHIASSTAHIYIHTATSIQLHVGDSNIWMDSGGQIAIKGNNIVLEGKESVVINGGKVKSTAKTTHEIQGGNVKSDATGNNVVKGAMVMLNPGG